MKAIATLIFVLFIGISAQAQNANEEVKVVTVTMGIEINNGPEVLNNNNNNIARVYKFKNSRIKKELSFATKLNKAKLA